MLFQVLFYVIVFLNFMDGTWFFLFQDKVSLDWYKFDVILNLHMILMYLYKVFHYIWHDVKMWQLFQKYEKKFS